MFTITKKLYSGFFAVLVLMAAVIILGYSQISSLNSSYKDLFDRRAKIVMLVKDEVISLKERQVLGRGYLLTGNEDQLKKYKIAQDEFNRISNQLDHLLYLKKGKALHKEIKQQSRTYDELMAKAFDYKKRNMLEVSSSIITVQTPPVVNKLKNTTDEFIAFQNKLMDDQQKAAANKVTAIHFWMVIIGLLSIAVSAGVAYYISRIISRPVKQMADAAEKIANGDLTVEAIQIRNHDEIGTLAAAFNKMADNLRQLLRHVASTSEQVAASSEELTASAEQTSKATEQVTLSIQEMAIGADKQGQSMTESSNAVRELSIGIQQIAANAQNVSDHVIETSATANHGGEAVDQAINHMSEINGSVQQLSGVIKDLGEHSAEIGQIVEVISGIASQTNLLALNAAIEAARAGENGRGFAVVADEVRKLAEQSADSAHQISDLIQMIQQETEKAVHSMTTTTAKVADGIQVVDNTKESFKRIEAAVGNVAAQIEEVSSAVQQMAAGTEQVVGSFETISQIAEDSASTSQTVSAAAEEQLASMEEITASANSLSQMAEELQTLVGQFKI